MSFMGKFAVLLVLAGVAAGVAAQMGAFTGKPPGDLGVDSGRLKPPSLTSNSVSSQASLYPDHPQRVYASVEPFPLKPAGAEASMAALEQALSDTPGITLVQRRPDYLYAQAQTRWLKFVDDVEFWLPAGGAAIEVRSASRLGQRDFGANRERVEALRARYLAAP